MKTGKIIKVLFGIALILTICFFANSVKAATTINSSSHYDTISNGLNNDGGIRLDVSAAAGNWYIYCRDYGTSFPAGYTMTYKIDTGAGVQTWPNSQNKGAAWAYLIGNNYKRGTASAIKDSRMQVLFWHAIGGSLTGYKNENPSGSDDEILEAKAYGSVIQGGSNLKASSYTNSKVTGPSELVDLKESGAPYGYTYGPFKIDCDCWIYNNTIKAGITDFHVSAIDANGNKINPNFEIIYNYKNKDEYDKQGVCKWFQDGSLTELSATNNNGSNIEYVKKFNNNLKKNFYIHFGQQVTSFSFSIKCQTIDASVTITPIYTSDKVTTTFTCQEHEGHTSVNGLGTTKGVIYVYGGQKYKYVGSYADAMSWYTSTPSDTTSSDGTRLNHYTGDYAATGVQHNFNGCGGIAKNQSYGYAGLGWYCPKCSAHIVIGSTGRYVHRYKYNQYLKWSCSYGNCGTKQTFSTQKLTVVKPDFSSTSKTLTATYTVPPPAPKTKVIEIKLQKYDISQIDLKPKNRTNIEASSKAKFNVVAYQNGQPVCYALNVTSSDTIEITADIPCKKPVYVNITETSAPDGFETIVKNINFILDGETFYPKFRPSQSEWNNSTFDSSTFGGWIWDDDGNTAFPNKYISSAGDVIEVNQQASQPYVISIFDKRVPAINLNLEKYNINDLDNPAKQKLDGFVFEITATQSGKTILPATDVNNDTSDDIRITPLERDRSPIDVEIKETKAPKGYDVIDKPIKIHFEYDEDNNVYNPTCTNNVWHADGERADTYISTSGDIYQLKGPWFNTLILSIYDKPSDFTFKMEKYNSYFSQNQYSLDGAKFRVKAVQEDGDTFVRLDITATRKRQLGNSYSIVERYGTNGAINDVTTDEDVHIIPKYVDPNKKIYILIEETDTPQGYMGLDKPIVMVRGYNVDSGNWDVGFRIEDINEINIFRQAFDKFASWAWVLTEDDKYIDENNVEQYSWNIPNTYCVNKNSAVDPITNKSNEIMEEFMYDHSEITDIIRVEYDDVTEKNIIKVYNEHEETDLDIKLEKYGYKTNIVEGEESIITNKLPKDDFTFNILIKQAENELVNEELTNLEYSLTDIINIEDPIYVIIRETRTPDEYVGMSKPINIKYTYNQTTEKWEPEYSVTDLQNVGLEMYDGEWQVADEDKQFEYDYESSEQDYIGIDGNGTIRVYNKEKAKIQIDLSKINESGRIIPGAKFNIRVMNVESLVLNTITLKPIDDRYHQITISNERLIDLELDGKITLEDVIYYDETEPIIVILDEITPPGNYDPIDESIYINIPYLSDPSVINSSGVEIENDQVDVSRAYNEDTTVISITVKNEHIKINLSGNVWLDKSTEINNKFTDRPDGIKNGNDEAMENIVVKLYRGDTLVTQTTTDVNGHYEFNNIDYEDDGYHIEFEYDGMKYECDQTMLESKAVEDITEREEFNNKFSYIYDTYALDNETIDTTPLTYDYSVINGVNVATLKTTQGNQVKNEFKMYARTSNVYDTTVNLDLALVEREEPDLAISLGLVNKKNVKVRDYLNTFFTNDETSDVSSVITIGDQTHVIAKIDIVNQGQTQTFVKGLSLYYEFSNSNATFDFNKTDSMNYTLSGIENAEYLDRYTPMQIQMYEDLYIPAKTSRTIYLVFDIPKSAFIDDTEITLKAVADLVMYTSINGTIDKDSQPNNLNLDTTDYSGNFEDDSSKIEKVLRIN